MGVMETTKLLGWVQVVEEIAAECLRENFRVELDLRAIFRSGGAPTEVLERARRVLDEHVSSVQKNVLLGRTLIALNRFEVPADIASRLAEMVASSHALLLARVAGVAYLEHFWAAAAAGEPKAVEKAANVVGLLPLLVDLEGSTETLFADYRLGGVVAA